MGFWQAFVVFSLMAVVFILWPFFRGWKAHKKALRADVRAELRDAVQEDRKKELDETHSLGDIDQGELESLKQDLEQTMLMEDIALPNRSQNAIIFGSKSRITLLVVSVCVPLLTLSLYFTLGSKPDWEIAKYANDLSSQAKVSNEERKELIAMVRDRLEDTPENGHLWFMLGSASTATGDYDEAVRAYKTLNTQYPDTAMILAELAQALFLRSGKAMTPEVRENTMAALALNANLPTALGLAGIDAYQSGKYPEAIQLWQKAVSQLDPQSGASRVLSQGIARAQIALSAIGGESKASGSSSEKDKGTQLSVLVSLGDEVKGLTGNETLFVYARAWQGPKMPLAIQRVPAQSFPHKVLLDKSMAMAQGMDITSVPQLEVVARISLSGQAAPQSGDWTASFGPIILGENDSNIKLVIGDRIP